MTKLTTTQTKSAAHSLLQPTIQEAQEVAVSPRNIGAKLGRRLPNSSNQRQHADRSVGSPVYMMRSMKEALGMTTRQLALEMQAFEKENKSHIFKRTPSGEAICQPVNQVLLSAYLQGWVLKDEYIKSMLARVKDFYDHKLKTGESSLKTKTMVEIMNGWFDRLGIDYRDERVSPARALAAAIAPYYKRPVLAKASGQLILGEKTDNGYTQNYSILTNANTLMEYADLSAKDKILVRNGGKVEIGQILQYSILYVPTGADKKGAPKFEPSKDHTTFYRWYKENKLPRTQITLQLVEAAVDMAEKAMKP